MELFRNFLSILLNLICIWALGGRRGCVSFLTKSYKYQDRRRWVKNQIFLGYSLMVVKRNQGRSGLISSPLIHGVFRGFVLPSSGSKPFKFHIVSLFLQRDFPFKQKSQHLNSRKILRLQKSQQNYELNIIIKSHFYVFAVKLLLNIKKKIWISQEAIFFAGTEEEIILAVFQKCRKSYVLR